MSRFGKFIKKIFQGKGIDPKNKAPCVVAADGKVGARNVRLLSRVANLPQGSYLRLRKCRGVGRSKPQVEKKEEGGGREEKS